MTWFLFLTNFKLTVGQRENTYIMPLSPDSSQRIFAPFNKIFGGGQYSSYARIQVIHVQVYSACSDLIKCRRRGVLRILNNQVVEPATQVLICWENFRAQEVIKRDKLVVVTETSKEFTCNPSLLFQSNGSIVNGKKLHDGIVRTLSSAIFNTS